MANWLTKYLFGENEEAPKDNSTNLDKSVPGFLKEAAYTYDETIEETIEKDWHRLIDGLSDYVLAEQISEREMADKKLGYIEHYAEHFQKTLKDVVKNRKKAEDRLYKMMPRHSQLDSREFFDRIHEQNDKEKEAEAKALEYYPPAGIDKNKNEGMKKIAADGDICLDASCADCLDATDAYADKHGVTHFPKEAMGDDEGVCKMCDQGSHEHCSGGQCTCHCNKTESSLKKEAKARGKKAKWSPGQELKAKREGCGCTAVVVYVNEEKKTYTVKVDGTMYPSYYAWEDAHETFDKINEEDSKNAPEAKARGVSRHASPDMDTDGELVQRSDSDSNVTREAEGEEKEKEEVTKCEKCDKPGSYGSKEHPRCLKHSTPELPHAGLPKRTHYVLEAQDEKGFFQEVRRSTFLPDLELKADQLLKAYPERKINIFTTIDPEWGIGQILSKMGRDGYKIVTVDTDNENYRIAGPGYKYPVDIPFVDAHDIFSPTVKKADASKVQEASTSSALSKTIGAYSIRLNENDMTLKSDKYNTKRIFATTDDACRAFLKLETGKDVREAFELNALEELDTLDALSFEMLTPNQMHDYAEKLRRNLMTMEDLQQLNLSVETIARIKRFADAENAAIGNVPGVETGPDEGGEGDPGMGVAPINGTGVYVEPSRGGNNVMQKEAYPHGHEEEMHEHTYHCPMCGPLESAPLDQLCPKCGSQVQQTKKAEALPSADPFEDRPVAKEMDVTFEIGQTAILNSTVGSLTEGSEVRIVGVQGLTATFESVANPEVIGAAKISKLDFATIETGIDKKAADEFQKEKYQWENNGLDAAYELGDCVRISKTIMHNGVDMKGQEGSVLEKVIMTPTKGKREMYYLVELYGEKESHPHPMTLPADVLSKKNKEEATTWRTAEEEAEFAKTSVIKQNIDVVNEYLKTFKDVSPTVLSDTMVREYMRKQNLQASKEDLKEVFKLLQSNGIEVRVSVPDKAAPNLSPEEMGDAPAAGAEDQGRATVEEPAATPESSLKTSVKLKKTNPDGSTLTREIVDPEEMAAYAPMVGQTVKRKNDQGQDEDWTVEG